MPSNLHNIKDSGRACVGCGATDRMLMRLRTYSPSLCCAECFMKPEYAKCANVNPVGTICGHDPVDHQNRVFCKMAGCGCPSWRHGLEGDFDRQLAAGVGVAATTSECKSFGANFGKCGRIIFAKPDGTLSRLCPACETRWVQETAQQAKEVSILLDMPTTGDPH